MAMSVAVNRPKPFLSLFEGICRLQAPRDAWRSQTFSVRYLALHCRVPTLLLSTTALFHLRRVPLVRCGYKSAMFQRRHQSRHIPCRAVAGEYERGRNISLRNMMCLIQTAIILAGYDGGVARRCATVAAKLARPAARPRTSSISILLQKEPRRAMSRCPLTRFTAMCHLRCISSSAVSRYAFFFDKKKKVSIPYYCR